MDEIICPQCGAGNSEFNLKCSQCGEDLSLLSREDMTAAPTHDMSDPMAPTTDATGKVVREFHAPLTGADITNPSSSPMAAVGQAGDTAPLDEGSSQSVNQHSGSGSALPCPGDLIIDRYQVIELIGRGGMGVVYKALDTQLDRFVALKLLTGSNQPEEKHARDLIREAKTVSALNHRNIVTVFNLSTLPGYRFIVMEYLKGDTLHAILKRGGTAYDLLLDYALQATDALEAAHLTGIVHSDIKPGNIMVTEKGEVKVLDFGLARYRRGGDGSDMLSSRQSSTFAGTFAYMSPEQAQGGPLDVRTDIFSLGILLYEMFLGRHPFQGPHPAAILHNICFIEPAFDYEVPPGLVAILQKALQKDRAKRYQSMNELRWDLAQMLNPTAASRRGFPRPAMARMIAKPQPLLSLPLKLALASAFILGCVMAGLFLRDAPQLPGIVAGVENPVVVVLPFRVIGGEPADQALCDGLLEALTGKLSALERGGKPLKIIAAAEVKRLDVATTEDARRYFSAGTAVEGSLQRFGGQLRFIVNLVDAGSLTLLQSKTVDGDANNILALQDKVVDTVVTLLALVGQSEPSGSASGKAIYQDFLKAKRHLIGRPNSGDVEAARRAFEKVLVKDPQFVAARAELVGVYLMMWRSSKDPDLLSSATNHAQRALADGGHLAAAWEKMGACLLVRGRFDEALAHFEKSLSLDPIAGDAQLGAAQAMEGLGRWSDAEAIYRSRLEIEANSYAAMLQLGEFYTRAGLYRDAQLIFGEARQLQTKNPAAYQAEANLLAASDRSEDALILYRRALALRSDAQLERGLGQVLIRLGRGQEAMGALQRVVEVHGLDTPQAWADLGDARKLANQTDGAMAAYSRALKRWDEILEVSPNHRKAQFERALVLAKMGQGAAACSSLAAYLPGDDNELLLIGAEVYEIAGRRGQALEFLAHGLGASLPAIAVASRPGLANLIVDSAYLRMLGEAKP